MALPTFVTAMKASDISFIIPVYNRPDEIQELLNSFVQLDGPGTFEIVIVEDGSTNPSDQIVSSFEDRLNITYLVKDNSGPGHSRNYGMKRAGGSYFIILDSDVILPKNYLNEVLEELNGSYSDFFGGPDKAHASFSNLQKAIDYSMTSFLTTGGIRGKGSNKERFQPRSFNMGISKQAFTASGGFGKIHPGEDPDLSIRLTKGGYASRLFPKAYVYHKRRISWNKFYKQVNKFGKVRAILNKWYPETTGMTYWFPLLFVLGLIGSIILWFTGVAIPIYIYGLYFILVFLGSWIRSGRLEVACLSIVALLVQFIGYGLGFLNSNLKLLFSKKSAEELFPNLFFD